VQHACYNDWSDVPPLDLQWREEHRIEQLNTEVYGAAWEWLPLPVWLTLIDPDADGAELQRLVRVWESRRTASAASASSAGDARRAHEGRQTHGARPKNRTLPVLRT
jgi:hypothetical protein